jgi:hypothetical protein
MTPFALGLDSPGKRLTSTRDNREGVRLYAIIAEHFYRGHHGHLDRHGKPCGRYTKRDIDGIPGDETTCNLLVQDVAEAMSVMLPRGVRANTLIAWLEAEADKPESPWEVVTSHVAQAMADEGQLVIACWSNPQPPAPGHVAIVVPSLEDAGSERMGDVFIAQAGRINFTRGTVQQGFGIRGVTYLAHP